MAAPIVRFWQELKRRKVIRVAVAYALIAWIVVEVASVLLPTLLLPDWSLRLVTVLALLGFPIAVVLAWVFEITPGGVTVDEPASTAVTFPPAGSHQGEKTGGLGILPSAREDKRRSILVLPFVNLSDEEGQAYFSDGITDEIMALLSRQPELWVISRTTSFTFKGSSLDVKTIAQKLNVEMVLEGSVRRAGDKVRIIAQLIDPVRDAHLWSDRFDRELTDIFAVQGEIARSIVDALQLDPLSCPETVASTEVIEAYDYYLRGRQYFYALTETSLNFARQMFQQAIDKDPHFARAHAGLANTESIVAQWFDHSPAILEAADRASLRALELAPDLAEAHSARGYALTLRGDFTGAAEEFERALQLEPGNYEALYLFGRSRYAEGMMAEAAGLFGQAHDAQPDEFQAVILREAALRTLETGSEYQEVVRQAIQAVRRRLELNPDDQRALNLGCGILISAGQVEEGLAMARKLLLLAPNDTSALYNTACAFAHAGKNDEALDLLERRVAMGGLYREWVEKDPDFDNLRKNPRFEALLERMSSPRVQG